MQALHLSQLWHYPLKSAQGIALQHSALDGFGLEYDRRWVLIDDHGQFISQRSHAQLGGLTVHADVHGLTLHLPAAPVYAVADPSRVTRALVWGDAVDGWGVADAINAQLSAWLGQSLRLVYCPDSARRGVDEQYAAAGHYTAFSDGFPLLLITQASLDALSAAWGSAIDVRRFRPNLVIAGDCEPFAEDTWRSFQIGDLLFEVVKPCSRCVIPSLDPNTQQPTDGFLKFLAQQRRHADGKIYLGQNVIMRTSLAQSAQIMHTASQQGRAQGWRNGLWCGQPVTVLHK